jgi:hypothetical protein
MRFLGLFVRRRTGDLPRRATKLRQGLPPIPGLDNDMARAGHEARACIQEANSND